MTCEVFLNSMIVPTLVPILEHILYFDIKIYLVIFLVPSSVISELEDFLHLIFVSHSWKFVGCYY